MAKRKNKAKKWIIIGIILAIIIVGYFWIKGSAQKLISQMANDAIIETKVGYGTIDVKITGNGAVESLKRYEIFAPMSGEIKNTYVEEGNTVKKDKVMFRVGSYDVKAPVAGTIITKNFEKGDYISTTSSTGMIQPLAVLADMSKVKINIPVDELEISKIKIGMEADIVADALIGETFKGTITKIASEGKNINGVTTYDVTIEIAEYGNLKIGMNVDVEVIAEKKESILTIPMSTINKTGGESYVYIKDEEYTEDEKNKTLTIPTNMSEVKGYKKQVVTVGINNKDNIEILEGLKEGDKIYSISAAKSLTEYMIQNSGGGMGMNIGM